MSKGSKRRPTDEKAYSDAFDRIFGKNTLIGQSPNISMVPCYVCKAPSAFQYVDGSFCSAHWNNGHSLLSK